MAIYFSVPKTVTPQYTRSVREILEADLGNPLFSLMTDLNTAAALYRRETPWIFTNFQVYRLNTFHDVDSSDVRRPS
jgi:hypothetical protein